MQVRGISLESSPDPLPGILLVVAHLDGKRLRTHRRDGPVSDLIHHLRDWGHVIGPHHETPETLLGVPYGLIDEIDLIHYGMNPPLVRVEKH